MRTTFFTLFFTSFFCLKGHSQFCLSDGITFFTQADIDNFPINYPGCTVIEGNVQIAEIDSVFDIVNLNGLSQINTIGGWLNIINNPVLTSLSGLNELSSIGGDLIIGDNALLPNLNGLNSLTTIGGSLSLAYNDQLESLDGLEKLTSIGWDVSISENNLLSNVDGLNNLIYIDGNLVIVSSPALTGLGGLDNLISVGGGILLVNNGNLANLDEMNNLKTIGGDMSVRFCEQMTSIAGFQNLETIGGALVCDANPSLNTFSGLNKLETLGDTINISGNSALTEISGLNNLQHVKSINIGGNQELAIISGFQKLLAVDENLAFNGNSLSDLSGFGLLATVGGNLWLQGNHLENLDGFKSLETVGGKLYINENAALSALSGLEKLESVGGTLELNTNYHLHDLTGLDNLTSIGGSLKLLGNDSLTNLNGLGKLESIGETLEIVNPPANLYNLKGLDSLKLVGKSVIILNNLRLKNLTGLENLDSVGGRFEVGYNPELTYCAVEGLCHQLEISPDSVFIESNAPGCNDTAEVKAGCDIPPGQCLIGGILFDNQAKVDNFINDYPGCSHIVGPVSIFGADISNLDGLSVLTAMGNELKIESTHLTDLSGLGNLSSIAGNLQIISYNDSLTSLSGLESLTSIGGNLVVSSNPALTSLQGLGNVASVGGHVDISYNEALTSLSSLEKLTTVKNLTIKANTAMTSLSGLQNITAVEDLSIDNNYLISTLNDLENIASIGGDLNISNNILLTDISALAKIKSVGGYLDFSGNTVLPNLHGLENLDSVGVGISIQYNDALTNLTSLSNLKTVGSDLHIQSNNALANLNGLEGITSVGGSLYITHNPLLLNLSGLDNLASVKHDLYIAENAALLSLDGLSTAATVDTFEIGSSIWIYNNTSLADISALAKITEAKTGLIIYGNSVLPNLHGLETISSVGWYVEIHSNPALTSLEGLKNVTWVDGSFFIYNNASLSDCSVFAICNHLVVFPDMVVIENNATGCNSSAEVEAACDSRPVTVTVLLDNSGTVSPLENIRVSLSGDIQMNLRPTDANGFARFAFLESGDFMLDLPQAPNDKWNRSEVRTVFVSSTGSDSTHIQLLLTPLTQCPELTATIGLPSNFRGCLVNSEVQVAAQNTGTVLAEGVKTAVVMPSVFELVASSPLVTGQNGDTLYFELGDLKPFETATVMITVKTKCDTFLLEQTLCWETYAATDNSCPTTLPAHSEIKLSAECVSDTIVRFTLKNIGNAPTLAWHEYTIIKNEEILYYHSFSLSAQQSLTYDFPADGATWRMEATKFDDGTQTAVALENCGGLTPGYITAFWLDEGPVEYDFDCRQVIGSFDPNQKTAVPTGTGAQSLIVANRPLQYTIDFQNTGTDTAFRVLLRDELPPHLDINTFRPGFSSHPCTWEIRGNTLDVLFFPIDLPDSNVNEPASHGFFSFDIDQKPDLPDGTSFYNTASIIFDFNPPIVTNTVRHTIGQLTVQVDEPQQYASLWEVWGNPIREVATFRAKEFIEGEKRFELYDAAGRLVRAAQFSGQAFDFQRDFLPGGLYFFRIGDAQGRVFSGKIVVMN